MMDILNQSKKLEDFYADNEKIIVKLINLLKGATGLPFREYDYRYRMGSTSWINGEAALHLIIEEYDHISNIDRQNFDKVLPLTLDGYHFELLSIFDFDYDDDRMWYPGISLRVTAQDGQQL